MSSRLSYWEAMQIKRELYIDELDLAESGTWFNDIPSTSTGKHKWVLGLFFCSPILIMKINEYFAENSHF